MRRLVILVFGLIALAIGVWIGALVLLPNAPPRVSSSSSGVSQSTADAARVSPGGPYLAMPIATMAQSALQDSWGDPRDNGLRAHHGTDIMAPSMTPVLAVAPGIIEKLFQSAAGGTTIYERSAGRDWTFYYAHLAAYEPGLHEGQVVQTGDRIGFVGDTGDAGPGNYHLHFGLTRTTPDQHWYQGNDVDPFPYLAGKQPVR